MQEKVIVELLYATVHPDLFTWEGQVVYNLRIYPNLPVSMSNLQFNENQLT